jgi:hypothetical protein
MKISVKIKIHNTKLLRRGRPLLAPRAPPVRPGHFTPCPIFVPMLPSSSPSRIYKNNARSNHFIPRPYVFQAFILLALIGTLTRPSQWPPTPLLPAHVSASTAPSCPRWGPCHRSLPSCLLPISTSKP